MTSVSDRVVLRRGIVAQSVVSDDVIHIAIALVIDAVVKAGLARVAYELTPIASLKGKD